MNGSKYILAKTQFANSEWKEEAACRRSDPDIFFPGDGKKIDSFQEARAKLVCAGCVVVNICLETALIRGEHGIWGGTTEDERKRIIAHRRNNSIALGPSAE